VSYCHWSHFEPGVLNIQVKGNAACQEIASPAARLFRRIPEPYRQRVEKAIRDLGKWAEGEPESASAASPARKSEGVLSPAAIDELEGDSVPLVAIPYARRRIVEGFIPLLSMLVYALLLPLSFIGWMFLLLFSSLLLIQLGLALTRLIGPEFAIEKGGIRLPFSRRASGSWSWRQRGLGWYGWNEVSYCRWSRYSPGTLFIQVMAARSWRQAVDQPPARLEYRVAEPYRQAVEQAIRAMGKWSD
jgi:hypothetical protein